MQPGEVVETYADIEKSVRLLNFHPTVQIEEGIPLFVDWFNDYKNNSSAFGSVLIRSLAEYP